MIKTGSALFEVLRGLCNNPTPSGLAIIDHFFGQWNHVDSMAVRLVFPT